MLTIIRDIRTDKAVLGRLYFCGKMICYTLENASKAIPCGLYALQNSKSPKFKRELPLLFNSGVPASRGIRIHRGNTYKDSKGCVLVGMCRKDFIASADDDYAVTESAPAETMVTMICRSVSQLVICEA
jgi:hypothetical protein